MGVCSGMTGFCQGNRMTSINEAVSFFSWGKNKHMKILKFLVFKKWPFLVFRHLSLAHLIAHDILIDLDLTKTAQDSN
jgi:hypothetical protein